MTEPLSWHCGERKKRCDDFLSREGVEFCLSGMIDHSIYAFRECVSAVKWRRGERMSLLIGERQIR